MCNRDVQSILFVGAPERLLCCQPYHRIFSGMSNDQSILSSLSTLLASQRKPLKSAAHSLHGDDDDDVDIKTQISAD